MSKSDQSTERTDEDERDPAGRIPHAGDRIGKYVVIETIGEGAMGVVVRAYDPHLERAVAIKVVQPHIGRSERSEAARARLLVEARAQARISHPNVVAIYEVGEHEGRVFVAMELIDGVDLQRWLKQERRSWRAVVDAFAAAGRGLQQVHVAGLVHRDVKPANILMGSDGRVRIGDFGIARASFELPSPLSETSEKSDVFDLETTALTAEGRVVGTFAYMAPEQHVGADVGPAADQYAFCVSLYEALWRVRPFATDMRRLLPAKLAGPVEPPRTGDVPRWLFSIVTRGLQPDPSHRYADMAEICAALGRDPGARRRRITAIAAGALVLGGGLAVLATRPGPCDERDDPLAGVWDPPTRAAVEDVFGASDRPWAAQAWAHVGPRIDAYATEWSAMRRDACEATHVHGDQSVELLDRRTVCLEARRRALAAATEVLATGGPEAIDHAFDLVGRLRPLAPCADAIALASAIEPPDEPEMRAAVDAVRVELARARALVDAGHYRDAEGIAHASTTTARELGYAPLLAEALAFEGESQLRVGVAALARAALEESLWTAIGVGHDEAAADAASNLVWLAGHEQSLPEALRWGELASASLRRRHSESPTDYVLLENSIGGAQINAAHFDEGLQTFERALARIADDPDSVARAGTLRHNIAKQWLERGEFARAREVLEPTIAELEPVLGRDHPRLASMRGTLAQVLGSAGEHQRAAELFQEEVDGLRVALGDDALQVAYARSNLALELGRLGKSDECIAVAEQALATFERSGDLPGTATTLGNLADEFLARGAYDAAAVRFERTLAVLQKLDPDGHHPDQAYPLVGRGRVRLAQGRFEDALVDFEHGDRIVRESQAPLGSVRGLALDGKGSALVELHRVPEALDVLAAAIEIVRTASDVGPDSLPLALKHHAEVLDDVGRHADALVELDEALTIANERHLDRVIAKVELERTRCLTALGRAAFARASADAASEAAGRVEPSDPELVAETRAAIAKLSGD